jgi:hypothetical protein
MGVPVKHYKSPFLDGLSHPNTSIGCRAVTEVASGLPDGTGGPTVTSGNKPSLVLRHNKNVLNFSV